MDFYSPVIFPGIFNASELSSGQPPAALVFIAALALSGL